MERGRLSYDMPTLLRRIPADNAYDALRNIPSIMANEGSLSVGNPNLKPSDTWRDSTLSWSVPGWGSGSLSVIYRFGNYKQKQQKEIDTSRLR